MSQTVPVTLYWDEDPSSDLLTPEPPEVTVKPGDSIQFTLKSQDPSQGLPSDLALLILEQGQIFENVFSFGEGQITFGRNEFTVTVKADAQPGPGKEGYAYASGLVINSGNLHDAATATPIDEPSRGGRIVIRP